MKVALAYAGVVMGWLLVVVGAWILAENVYVLYILITGQVAPGERYLIDDFAPTPVQALTATLSACAVLAIGFVLIRIAERHKANEAPRA